MRTPEEYVVGLEGWVLQDGTYTDFAVGQRRQFALEFGYRRSRRLQPCAEATPSLRHTGDRARYEVEGTVVATVPSRAPHAPFVLDCGLHAYNQGLRIGGDGEEPAVGDHVRGEISLLVDHFSYVTELNAHAELPPLVHTWEITGIEAERGPGTTVAVERTEAWPEDDALVAYYLRCRLLGDPPERTMSRSGDRTPYGPLAPGEF